MKVQAHVSLKPPLEYNEDQLDAFDESRFVLTFLTILGVTKVLCSFKLVLEEKTVRRKLNHQNYSSKKGFHQMIFPYQMQKATPWTVK